jgi:hypothetical protein
MRISAITFFAALFALRFFALADSTPLPTDTTRILKKFDFEERALGNDEDQPMNWEKVTGVDYPQYVGGKLTSDRHRSGNYCFRIDLDGGSCQYRYQPGLLKVQPGTHYRFEGYCKTSVLRYARARLTAYFIDQDLRPIPNSAHHSELYAGNGEDEDWHLLSVELTADQDHAAFLVVEMELLQPNQYSTSTLGRHALFLQDIHGSAWFDDLAVTQVPQVALKTARPGNVFRQSDPLKLTVELNDRETDDLTAQLLVDDALGKRVYQHTGTIDLSSAKVLGPGVRELSIDLPTVSPGWYRASLLMMSHGTYVGQESVAWILLADDGAPAPADARFGVVARDLPFEAWGDLPKFLPLLAAGRVSLPMWSSRGDVQQMDADQLDELLRTLQSEGISPAGCLVQLPPKLGEQMGGSSWLQVLTAPPDSWQNPIAFLISRHANRVDRWQLGPDETEEFADNPEMRKVYARVYQQFSSLIDKPDLAMPCPVTYDLPNPMPPAVELSVPTNVLPAQIPLYLQDFHAQENQSVCLSLSALDPDQYDRTTRIADLTQRVVYALASNVPRFDLPMPINVHQQGDEQTVEPQELAIIERTLLSALSGAQYRGKLPIADDVNAFLFERNRKGIAVLWTRDVAGAKPRTVSVNLGEHLISLDLWGNATALSQPSTPQGEDEDDPNRRRSTAATSQITVGRLPIILTGVDSDMGRLRVSLSLDQPLIESTFEAHTRKVRFSNPYNQPIGGTLKLHGPPGWNLNPPSFTFTLNPGETFERDLVIEFPYNSVAGPQNLTADFNLQADRHVVFSEPLGLVLGLSDIGTRCMAYRSGNDVVVQQMISNYGEHPISYSTFAAFPGRPRIERLDTTLTPGQTVIKKYRFVKVPVGKTSKIRVGLKEVDGNRILNDEVEIE